VGNNVSDTGRGEWGLGKKERREVPFTSLLFFLIRAPFSYTILIGSL
jgi:hypothetical protein